MGHDFNGKHLEELLLIEIVRLGLPPTTAS
jgi:hypothetical protein